MAETDLLSRARATRVVVIGGGIAGLVAARECARVGFTVTLLEASDALGGQIAAAHLDGVRVDAVADSYAPGVQGLVDELDLGDRVVPLADRAVWISGLPGAAPVPAQALAGIPANAWADDVRRIIGWGGAWRAYLDRLRPPLTIGRQKNLGTLVRSRLGARVLDRLVTPLTRGVYGVDPSQVDADAAVPGLSTALTRLGSLSGAVADLLVDAPDTTRRSLRGGMSVLVDALAVDLAALAVDLRVGAPADRLERDGEAWRVHVAGDEPLPADVVIVATPRTAALALLDAAGAPVAADDPAVPAPADVVTLLVASRDLDAAPRGGAVYPVSAQAASVLHADAAWPWLAEALGGGRHLLRVRLPRPDAAASAPDDDAVIALALAEASAALGVALPPGALHAAHRVVVEPAAPASVLGHADTVAAVRRSVARTPGLAVVGAWLGGAGIASTVADAIAEADRVRHRVLWANDSGPDVKPPAL
ncbi:protoporphyrinogen/coproporphyrinogen oxidase [Microbacterium festucae]|uniref:protoporphyrinogen/coproporphyrinogen oxidase n=1 Tax=Microbacterium festucae TaxID=2977531 RepID=UPI0028FC187B|nr:FAD-dependent oxidoreductase [Microbacterium festucae]